MNDKKTEFLVIGTRQQIKKVSIDCLTIGAEKIMVAEKPVKNLGVWLDSTLSIDAPITKTCSAAFYYLYNIKRIRRCLSKESTETLIQAFISSRLDYCNSLFDKIPACQLQKLQRIQNAAARLILQECKFCHITPLLMTLHWLPVKYIIHLKILLLTFKAINLFAPSYICDFVTVKKPSNYNLRSNNSLVFGSPKVKSLATLGERSFSFAAPKLWYKLPNYIRTSASITIFKLQLKTYLFREAFDLNEILNT